MPSCFSQTAGLLCLCLLLAGCGGPATPVVVRGKALYRGQPLAGGTVTLTPNSERGSDGPILQGHIDEEGNFNAVPIEGTKIRAGWYRIAIAPRAGSQDFPTVENPYPGLPLFFRNPILSGLEKEVKSEQENIFHFDLGDS